MILVTKAPVALAQSKEGRGYDNRNPRVQQSRLTGFGARALAAHQNMIEAFPVFAAGVLVVLATGTLGAAANVINKREVNLLVESAQLPSYQFDTSTLNMYNRKKNCTNKNKL